MATTKSEQVITLASLSSLKGSSDINSKNQRSIIWKEFGVYLDKKLDYTTDIEHTRNSSTSSHLISNHTPDSSYLSQVIKYKICTSCDRPIGESSLKQHYTKCLEMKQNKQKQQEEEDGSSRVNSNGTKRKRGRGANPLLDLEPSSVDSSRNSTPVPGTPTSGAYGVAKPKKKYKKSQTQKEKEAANAALRNSEKEEALAYKDDSSAGTGEGSTKKKKQMKPKTQAKPKGPVDVEKQCGVPLPSGGFCARSLTCKTHSMGAKRAVLGRSAPYDVLLQQYQKRNQAKLAASNVLAAQRRENAQFTGGAVGDNDDINLSSNYNKILDPDEETHSVLEGLSKNHPIPLERKIILPARNRHKFLYMREAYANAFITSGNSSNASNQSGDQTLANQAISGSIGGLQGRCALVNVDPTSQITHDSKTQAFASIPGELYQVRAPLKAILLSAQHNAQQQQLFQQQVMKLQQQQQQQMLLMKQRQARAQAAQQQIQAGQGQ